MGRHSVPDDDDEADIAVVDVDDAESSALRGRHTRGEDLEDTGPVPGTEMRAAEARAAAQDDRPTQQLLLDELLSSGGAGDEPATGETATAEPVPESSAPAKPAAKKEPRGSQSTAADLALIRRHPAVRNRVIAAVIAPFVIYVAVLLLVGARGVQYLLWIWIPMVTAGVLAGLILDAAHRRLRVPDDPQP